MARPKTDVVIAGSVPANALRVEHRGVLPWIGRTVSKAVAAVGRVGKRAISSVPWNVGGGSLSAATTENALSLIPFFACIRVIADNVAAFPLQAFRDVGGVSSRVTDPQLFRRELVAAGGTMFDWVHKCVVSLALRGNAYGLIVARDGFGFATQIEWLNPDDIHVDEQIPARARYFYLGQEVPREDIVHIPWFTLPGTVVGLSPVAAFARSIGAGLSVSDFSKSWFDNGGQPPGSFKNTKKVINQEEAEEIKDRLVTAIRSHKPIVFGEDWDYTVLRVQQEEAQFISTMKLNATQMANIFGVPAELVGGESGGPLTYNNPEHDAARMTRFWLRPWTVRLEQAFTLLLPAKIFAMFNFDAVVRADLKTRYEAHAIALASGFLTVDEVRELEDRPPLPKAALTAISPVDDENQDESAGRVYSWPGLNERPG